MNFEIFYDYFQADVDYESLINPILPFLDQNKVILDAGCGSGYILSHLSNLGYQMIGIDKNQRMLELAQAKLKENNLDTKLFLHDLNQPLIQKFDQIICLLDVFHYFKGVRKLVKNLYNGLNPGGKLILDLYKDEINEEESDTFDDLSYVWKVSTSKNRITHVIDVMSNQGQYQFLVKQYYYALNYYRDILKSVGFSIIEVFGFDDRKVYFVCTK